VERRIRISGKKLTGWFIALALILACAPGAIPPVPTLNPNAINTFIVQTANAASTRTAEAVPVYAATSTFAPTFTPEPTYTLVGPIIISSPTASVGRVQYFRIKHDNQLEQHNYKSRTADPNWPTDIWGLQTTEIARMLVGPKGSSGTDRTPMVGAWETYINSLNDNNLKKLSYVKGDATALFNGNGFPQMESLTMGGNIITLDEIRGEWGRVHTFDYGNPGPFDGINYTTRPDLVHKFVVVGWSRKTKTTYLTNPPPPYGDLYYPLVTSRPVWISMELLEAFPFLPKTVTAKAAQDIRKEPNLNSDLTGFEFSEGESATMVEYYPSGSNVWGRRSNGGWIALLIHEKGVQKYLTDWQMATRPPIPPYESPAE